jgi:hypothetical protein
VLIADAQFGPDADAGEISGAESSLINVLRRHFRADEPTQFPRQAVIERNVGPSPLASGVSRFLHGRSPVEGK